MEKQSFEHNLIKGRIAETIFEMMFRETKKFTVLHFGYESTEPILAQYRHRGCYIVKKVLNQVSNSPDFILMKEDKTGVYFVEVKYRANLTKNKTLEIASEMAKKWELCYLFVISKEGFSFSSVNTITSKGGEIEQLSPNWVSQEIQDKYKVLVNDWLWSHRD